MICLPARAVILYSSADPAANKVAPTGVLADSGWQYQGTWGGFLATPIAPSYFIAAKHVGGSIGNTFTFDNVPYVTIERHDSPSSDLTIWKVSGTFATFATLYTASDEVGKDLVVFGRGTERGSAVTTAGEGERGWSWGASNGTQRWGENTVSQVVNGGAGLGNLLVADFDAGLGPGGRGNEAHLSVGDSSGAVFIQEGGLWKLAGINYAVDAYFSYTGTTGTGFNAAIYDARGLYFGNDSNGYSLINPLDPQPASSSFYATRISDNAAWITAVVPEPSTLWMLLPAAVAAALLPRRRRTIPPHRPSRFVSAHAQSSITLGFSLRHKPPSA